MRSLSTLWLYDLMHYCCTFLGVKRSGKRASPNSFPPSLPSLVLWLLLMENQFTGGGPILISDAKSTLVKSDQSTAAGVTSRALGIRLCPNVPYGDTGKVTHRGSPRSDYVKFISAALNRVNGAEPQTIPPEHPLSSSCRDLGAVLHLPHIPWPSPGPAARCQLCQ